VGSLFQNLAVADVHQCLFRNIVSLRESEDLFDDLSDDEADQQIALSFEMNTKPSWYVSNNPIIDRPFEESTWNDAVEYPFREWAQSRFSDGTYGVWYGSDNLETTLHETVFHWTKFLDDSDFLDESVSIQRKVYTVQCDAALLDFRPHVDEHPALIHSTDYSFSHQIGSRIKREGHPGLVTISARCEGENFAIFNASVLSNPHQECYLTYRKSENEINVERRPGEIVLVISLH
jgi:hypothetical protein